jgi:hypothetical protein
MTPRQRNPFGICAKSSKRSLTDKKRPTFKFDVLFFLKGIFIFSEIPNLQLHINTFLSREAEGLAL